MLALTKTLLDITLLAKGPDAIPRSWVLLAMSVALWLFALLAMMALLASFTAQVAWRSIASALLGLLCYTIVLATMGVMRRAVPTMVASASGAISRPRSEFLMSR